MLGVLIDLYRLRQDKPPLYPLRVKPCICSCIVQLLTEAREQLMMSDADFISRLRPGVSCSARVEMREIAH